ncbi:MULTISPECIES: DUF4135 domain-containing protein [unclassified Kitasatospora]|uniref:DUF4135 domain-containing protein n=1 Tax=unclassified Kitasatospora TaxID=2633591 RepID=UPI000710275C|nr:MULTISPECIES: DUF4135 domain-containing protein [unclassified Kitasatospora]KQV18808.1 hypothetical protein ASC99_06360 [Kitasatospora sp. Root107]KRB74789.1 hypothetical protein ASE03_20295 [Kitasatospora sp. Root187]
MPLDLQTWLRPVDGASTPHTDDRAADPTDTAAGVLLPGLDRGDDRLRAVVTAAASFADRAEARPDGSAVFAPDPDEDRRGRTAAVDTWLRRAAGEHGGAGALLDHLAETGRPLGDGLRGVVLADPAVLPDWALALAVFLRTLPAAPSAETSAPGALGAAFVAAAGELLPYGTGGILGVPVSDRARADLAGTLTGRLVEACNLAFCHELQTLTGRPRATDWDAAGGLDTSQEGWLARLERLPALAYLVGTVCRQWQHVQTELFARLAADRALLVEQMWEGEDPGPLDSVRGEAGDRHAGGRSVSLLYFASGRAVVYKPKDMRHATAYLDLSRRLNEELSLDLPVRTVLIRSDRGDDGHAASLAAHCENDYGWEELVPHRPCADAGGFARFYRRLGMTIRLVQLLEGRDLWADNLLADGEHPALIDLECLLYPRVQTPPTISAEQHGLLDDLESTVVRTAMAFQPWTPAKASTALDIGCLSRIGSLEITPGVPALPLPPYRPVHLDETGETVTADPWEYSEELTEGYREMHRTLHRLRDELASPEGPLASFRGIWVRYIWRHTWDGYKIIRASTSPLALDSGATRETVIAGALQGAITALAGDPGRGDLLEVVLAELDSFRQLDIPFFRSLTSSTSAFTADGQEIPGHFRSTGWQRLQDRVAELDSFDLDAHLAVLTGCVDAARGGAELPVPAVPRSVRSRIPGNGELLDRAVEIGDRILADRRGNGWLGQSWYPGSGLRQVEVLGLDLASGTPGLAVLFAELWAATGEPRFHRAAHRTLTAAARLIDPAAPRAFAFAADSRLAGGSPVPGGFAGPGALIHALARVGTLLGEPELIASAQGLVPGTVAVATPAPARPGRPPRTPNPDVPLGSAGLLLNLLRLRRVTGPGHAPTDDGIRALAAAALEQLSAEPDADGEVDHGFLDLVPTGTDSIAAALARVVAEAPALLAAPDAVRERLRGHRFATATRAGRLACLDTAVALGAGIVDPAELAALTPPVSERQITGRSTRDLVATAGEALTAAEAGLLHTVPDPLDSLLPGPFYDGREAAALLVGELIVRHDTTGSWYPDRAADDRINLGALDGSAAVGLLLLRLLDPATAPLATLR